MGISYKSLEQSHGKRLDRLFQRHNCFIEVNPGNVILPSQYREISEKILELPVRDDDVWLISYPRTGSTWAMEMIWLLGNNLDYEGAARMQPYRAPLLELSALFNIDDNWLIKEIGDSVEAVRNLKSPRFLKTHLPWNLLPKEIAPTKPKIIYVARNPKDLCVSYYHYCLLIHGISGTFNDFCECFLSENVPFGSFWYHILPFWSKRNDDNILFLKYEDMKQDFQTTIRKCAKFLNVDNNLTDQDVEKMCNYLKFEKMQKNPAVNLEPILNNEKEEGANNKTNLKFIRKGQIGDWRNYMSAEISERFDKWIEENTNETGLDFFYG